MSLNKILNRPMFRKEALRRGALKTINARVGVMVGAPTQDIKNVQYRPPAINKQGFYGRNIRPMLQRATPYVKGVGSLLSLPGYVGYEATGQVANAMGMKDSPYKVPLQLAGAYGATKLPGAAALAGLGMGPQLGIAALGGAGYYAYLKAQEQKERIAKMTPKEREEFYADQRGKALEGEAGGFSDADLFGKFVPKPPKVDQDDKGQVTLKRKTKRGGQTITPDQTDNLTAADNKEKIGNKDLVNIDKVVQNEKQKMFSNRPDGPDPNSVAPVPPVMDNIDKDDKKLSTNITKDNTIKGGTTPLTNAGSVNGKTYSSPVLQRGKMLAKEMMEGRQSQAGLLFLANLASGLLSGKSAQGGLSGAMDILGQALGPAANNYSIMKLKENEVENQIMSQALDIALAEYKLANTNEVTKGNLGRVQFVGPGGKVRNFDGGINENGIPYLLVGGKQVAAQDITGEELTQLYNDPTLKDFNYAQAIIKDTINDDEAKAHRLLLQNIKSKNIVYDVKEIIRATGSAGTKGNLQIALTKLNSVFNDFGLGSTKDAISKLDSNEQDFFRSLELGYNSGEITKQQYKQFKKMFNKKDMQKAIEDAAKENYKIEDPETGELRKPTTDELFELVNAQTTLAYALANSFKDTDRLTQKDVTAAMSVINILPGFGGAETALASLNALEKDLDRSITSTRERLERTYFTSDPVMQGFFSLLKGGDTFGMADTSKVISPEQRMDILQGIQF